MAVQFNEQSDQYTTTSGLMPGNGATSTFVWWVKWIGSATGYRTVWSSSGSGDSYIQVATSDDAGMAIRLYTSFSSELNQGQSVVPGQWFRCALVLNADSQVQATFYVGVGATGQLTANSTPSGQGPAYVPTSELFIGSSSFNGEWLNTGSIANFKQFSRVLTPQEIEQELGSWDASPIDLVRHYRFQVPEVTDYSGNNYHLTAGSTAPELDPDNPPIPDAATGVARVFDLDENEYRVFNPEGDEYHLYIPADIPRVGSNLLFETDFTTGKLDDFAVCQWNGRNTGCADYDGDSEYSAAVVYDPQRQAVVRFEIRDGDVPPFGGGERTEVTFPAQTDVVEGDERWFQWDMNFESGWDFTGDLWCLIFQVHPLGNTPPCVSINVGADRHMSLANNDPTDHWEISIGEANPGWHTYRLHVKFSQDDQIGFVSLFRDGDTVVHRTYCKTLTDAGGYAKAGVYRAVEGVSPTSVVTMGEFKVWSP